LINVGAPNVSVDKKELSEEEKKTQEYDKLAFRLVSYGAIPLLLGYTVYSRPSFHLWVDSR
jgi:hypothetical protein